jgi:hypothetical protein
MRPIAAVACNNNLIRSAIWAVVAAVVLLKLAVTWLKLLTENATAK